MIDLEKLWRPKTHTCLFGGGSGGGGNTTTTTNTTPWTGQQPFLSSGGTTSQGGTPPGLFQQAANLYQNYTPQYFGAQGTSVNGHDVSGLSTVSPFTDYQNQAIQQAANMGINGQGYLTNAENAVGSNAAQNPYSTPGNNTFNQYANGSMLSAGNPYFQNVANQIQTSMLPGLMSSFTQGSTDNPNVAFAASQGLGNAIGSVAEQNYQQGQQNQLAAAQGLGQNYQTNVLNQVRNAAVAPSLQGADVQNLGLLANAGATQQGQNQAVLNNLISQFNFQQQLPYQQLDMYGNSVMGNYGGNSTTTQPYYSNQAANILGGASSGLGILSGINGLTAGTNASSGAAVPGIIASMFK